MSQTPLDIPLGRGRPALEPHYRDPYTTSGRVLNVPMKPCHRTTHTLIAWILPLINWFSVAARSRWSRVTCMGLRALSISSRTCSGILVGICCAMSSRLDRCPITSFLVSLGGYTAKRQSANLHTRTNLLSNASRFVFVLGQVTDHSGSEVV